MQRTMAPIPLLLKHLMTKPTVAILPSIHALAGNTSTVAAGAIFSPTCIALVILIATRMLLAILNMVSCFFSVIQV